MAEARSAVSKPLVCKVVDHESTSWDAITKAWLKGGLRKYYRTRNSIRNGMWPTSVSNLSVICSLFFLTLITDPSFCKPLTKLLWRIGDQLYLTQSVPLIIRAAIISAIIGFIFIFIIMLLRQYILRVLLSYRGWMNVTSSRNTPKEVIIWGLIVRLVSGYQPSLYSFQRSLPRMPVSPLRDTIYKLFESLKPVCTEEELAMLKKQAKEFKRTVGPKLQKLLVLKSWLTQNYVTDWWEKYVYLRSRVPLPNNCNYYVIDQSYWYATNRPASRTASLLVNILKFKRLIDREELQPLVLRNTIPICMAQYERLFSTTRVPFEDMDELIHYDTKDSKHVIIVCKGIFYRMDVYDTDNQVISAKNLEERVEWIMSDAEKHAPNITDEEKSIAALTTLERNEWARIRKDYLCSGVNDESRDLIERSICIFWLIEDSPETLTERGKWILHGDGKSIWFDKCFNVLVFANGKCGLNCEHSLADAPAYAHMWEYALCRDVLEKTFDDDGTCMPPIQNFRQSFIAKPSRLVFEVTDHLAEKIRNAHELSVKNNNDLDLIVVDHNSWGKGEIKKCKISPDAFVQMAIQMAYYKDYGKFVQTYEASMTRLYLNGRTETVRSCSKETADFVTSMIKNDESKEEKIKLLNIAAAKHTQLYKEAMNGKGIDRHLFALFVASKGLGYESEFLQNVLTRPWTLSTSQTPHTQQTAVPDPNYKTFNDKMCPGGGFGPVSDEGYGISYMFPNNYRIFFHISSKKSCPHTDSARFGKLIYESLDEIKALFDD